MTNRYDVMVLGTGEAGIFAAHELALRCPEGKGLGGDQGADIYHRRCPIGAGQSEGLHQLQGVRHHVRLRRSRGLLRWQI